MDMSYQLTEDEYVHAQLGYWARVRRPNRLRIQVVVASTFVLIGLAVLATQWRQDKTGGLLLVSFGSFLFVDRYVLAPYRLRRMFRRSPNTSAPCRVVITDDGMKIVLPNSHDELRWGAFQKAHELANEFLLMYSPASFVILPKRAFDGARLEEFRSVLRGKGLLEKG
jgi:YcxB-like protein